MKNDKESPCRYCTDKSVCRGNCIDRMRYVRWLRNDINERLRRSKNDRKETKTHGERN